MINSNDPGLQQIEEIASQMMRIAECSRQTNDAELLSNYIFSLYKKTTQAISLLSEMSYDVQRPSSGDPRNSISDKPQNQICSVHIGMYNNILVVHTPLPPGRVLKSGRGAFAYRAELQSELIRHRSSLGLYPRSNSMNFLFSVGSLPDRLVKDHDNYFIKPIIDTITNSIGISDSGLDLSTAYYTTRAPELETGLYSLVFPAPTILQPCEALQTCLSVKWL